MFSPASAQTMALDRVDTIWPALVMAAVVVFVLAIERLMQVFSVVISPLFINEKLAAALTQKLMDVTSPALTTAAPLPVIEMAAPGVISEPEEVMTPRSVTWVRL